MSTTLTPYLSLMAEKSASDLYFTTGAPVCMKVDGVTKRISRNVLEPGTIKKLAYEIMDPQKIREFEETKEMNLGMSISGGGRYRVNVYYQRGEVSMVIRYIKCDIPSIENLGLPEILRDLVMAKNGLILVVGSTGSGKSTSLASMIEYRNQQQSGHILTIEDPIEYTFTHKKSIISQREVGLDTLSYANALREAMREAPDMIMIGEVRDRETMTAALTYADTGHLCVSTLHAVNANQAFDRMINLFESGSKQQILMDLSLNLRGIISQRLVPSTEGGRVPAVEILINTPYVSELIKKGEFGEIKEVMEKGAAIGMQTFDQALLEMYRAEKITLDEALAHADSRSNLEWQINFGGGIKSVSENDESLDFSTTNTLKKLDEDSSEPPVLSTPITEISQVLRELDDQESESPKLDDDLLDQDAFLSNDDDDHYLDSAKAFFEDRESH